MTRSLAAAAAFTLATGGAHAAFTLASPKIPAGGTIANRFVANMAGCKGENRSPALRWSGAPQGTGSFALTVFDPDAPGDQPHRYVFTLYALRAAKLDLAAGARPAAARAQIEASALAQASFTATYGRPKVQ